LKRVQIASLRAPRQGADQSYPSASLQTQIGREAVIVDERFNAGGGLVVEMGEATHFVQVALLARQREVNVGKLAFGVVGLRRAIRQQFHRSAQILDGLLDLLEPQFSQRQLVISEAIAPVLLYGEVIEIEACLY